LEAHLGKGRDSTLAHNEEGDGGYGPGPTQAGLACEEGSINASYITLVGGLEVSDCKED